MKLDVLNREGKKAGRQVDLPDAVFGVEPNEHAMYLAVKQFLANKRQGTHKTKERNEVKGSTRKIKRQKGTGTARAGDIKNPLFRGGGRVFGPEPRNYGFKLNKKLKEVARNSALSHKAKNEGLLVVEDLKLENAKTKDFVGVLKNWGVDGKKVFLLTGEKDRNLVLSSRNVPKAKVSGLEALNTYDIMNADVLLLTEGAAKSFSENK